MKLKTLEPEWFERLETIVKERGEPAGVTNDLELYADVSSDNIRVTVPIKLYHEQNFKTDSTVENRDLVVRTVSTTPTQNLLLLYTDVYYIIHDNFQRRPEVLRNKCNKCDYHDWKSLIDGLCSLCHPARNYGVFAMDSSGNIYDQGWCEKCNYWATNIVDDQVLCYYCAEEIN